MTQPIIIVQGGCWGSEAKGAIASYLCNTRKVDYAVRTGATNAGHTVYYKGKPIKMQQLPTGWTNPNTKLVIGAGALIDPDILRRECQEVSELTGADIRGRLMVDRRAGLHIPAHAAMSRASGRHHLIGATGKGCSEALIARISNRGTDGAMLFGESPYYDGYDVCDTEALLNWSWNEGAQILLEGTQGQLLDLYLGPYPYVTHKQTGPAQWMLEAGLSPALPVEVCMVVRTFPIRVAGNSGPMPQEMSWPELVREMNAIRVHHGILPLIDEQVIQEFEAIVRSIAKKWKQVIPLGSDGLDQHKWGNRVKHREALSELNAESWKSLPDNLRLELSKVFETTTVTKKMRRVARLDRATLEYSARQVRPHWIALTFMNYMDPVHWYKVPTETDPDDNQFIKWVEEACHAPVQLLTYGPADEHVVA